MIFKMALRGIKKNLGMNLLTLLQMTAVLLAAGIMVSSVYIRFKAYLPFKDYFEGEGIFCSFTVANEGLNPDKTYKYICTEEQILSRTHGEKVIGMHQAWLQPVGVKNLNLAKIMAYDDELIDRYTPELKEGSWFSRDKDINIVEAVVTENDCGWKTGSIITFTRYVNAVQEVKIKAKVVGVIKDGAEVIWKPRDSNYTYKSLYYPYYLKREDSEPLILFSESVLEKHLPAAPYTGNMLIKYPNGTSEKVIKEDMKALAKMNAHFPASLKQMDAKSKKYLYEQVYQLLPIVIVLMVLTMVSAVSSSALSARRNLKDYAKFYVLGLKWKECGLIHLAEAAVIGGASVILAAVGFAAINFTPLSEMWVVFANSWLFGALALLILLYLAFSMIMPMIMLVRTKPKTLLQTE